ncbi:MAG: hypothetical protein ACR2PR_11290 [Pseudohongiellaceae bacterium]
MTTEKLLYDIQAIKRSLLCHFANEEVPLLPRLEEAAKWLQQQPITEAQRLIIARLFLNAIEAEMATVYIDDAIREHLARTKPESEYAKKHDEFQRKRAGLVIDRVMQSRQFFADFAIAKDVGKHYDSPPPPHIPPPSITGDDGIARIMVMGGGDKRDDGNGL